MGNILRIVSLAMVGLLAVSCLADDFRETEQTFTLSETDMELLSGSEITGQTMASRSYPSTITGKLTLTSNHSWRAVLIPVGEGDDLSWIQLSEYSHINTSMSTQQTVLRINADRNRTEQMRVADIAIALPDGSRQTVRVVQKAASLELREPEVYSYNGQKKDIANIRSNMADTCFVKFVCNTAWTAKLLPDKTTADASILHPKGNDDAIIQLVFRPNLDDEEKTAAMVVEAPECGMSYTIEFVQQKGSVKL